MAPKYNARSQSARNKHHLHWTAREFRQNSILNKLREYPGLVISMNVLDHRDLHREMHPGPKPTLQQAEELLGYLGCYDNQSERVDYLDMAANFMSDKNPRYSAHLLTQRAYVLLTPYTQIERDIVSMERELPILSSVPLQSNIGNWRNHEV